MTALVPRLRMFAGPNGSGKSTIKDILPPEWLGVYVNADEMPAWFKTALWDKFEPEDPAS